MANATSTNSFEPPTQLTVKTSDGREISYYRYESQTSNPSGTILLAHAASFHGRIWDQIARNLTTDFTCVSFDFYGHGQSSGSIGAGTFKLSSWPTLFTDVVELTDRLDVDGPLFGAGHSLGGAALASISLKYETFFDSLWLYEPILIEDLGAFAQRRETMATKAEGRQGTFSNQDQAISWFRQRPPFDTVHPSVLQDYVRFGFAPTKSGIQLRCSPENEASIYRLGETLNIYQELSHASTRTLVAVGGRDPSASSVAARLVETLPNGEREIFDPLGHLGPLEDPISTSRSIARFLGRKP